MKKKKIPLRKCVACNENKSKKELIRIVKDKEQNIYVDLTGKMNGRGAYICSNRKCLEKAKKDKKLNKALGMEIPEEVYDKLNGIIDSKDEL